MAKRRRKPRPPRRAPGPNPPRWSSRMYVRLSPKDIAAFKFLLESNDNLAYLTIVDKFSALGQVVYSPGQEAELREFLEHARHEVDFTFFEPPTAPSQNAEQAFCGDKIGHGQRKGGEH